MNTQDLIIRHQHFVAFLMRQFGVEHLNETAINQLEEPRRTWFNWGISGFDRAENTFSFLQRFIPYSPSLRHLDIGCGPGYLSTVYAAHGFDSVGIDIGDLNHANQNKLDFPDSKLSFINADLVTEEAPNLGTFDIITIDNVIEHVSSPPVLISKLQSLLSRNGIVYLIIPNSRSIELVRSDPHYNQFGLSLLDKQDGDALLAALTEHRSYDVNTSFSKYDLANYYSIFRKYGFDPTLCDDLTPSEVAQRKMVFQQLDLERLKTDFDNQLATLRDKFPEPLFDKLSYLINLYLMELENDHAFALSLTDDRDNFILHQFIPLYWLGTWFFVLRPR